MEAKFVYESLEDVLKPKKLTPSKTKKWGQMEKLRARVEELKKIEREEDVVLDDVYDYLNTKQKSYVDKIIDGKDTIYDLYNKKWWRNGGWNGMMDAIGEFEEKNHINQPDFEDLDIQALIMKEFNKSHIQTVRNILGN